MSVRGIAGLLFAALAATASSGGAEPNLPTPSTTYEVQINGESFSVEANRMAKLESKKKPGVTYQVAVRVAPTQRVRLNTCQFDYDLPGKVEDVGDRANRSVRLTHELGFSILFNDLGKSLDVKSQEATLKMLVDSVASTLRDEKAREIEVGDPRQRVFGGSSARGMTIRYRDAKGLGHVYLVYVLTGPTFAATSIVGYLENDADDALPLVRKTLDSVQGIPRSR